MAIDPLRLLIAVIPDLVFFWLYLLVWLALPGAFVGWLLNRYFGSTRAVLLATEAFTLLPWILERFFYGFDLEELLQFFAVHFLLFMPILLAIYIGYYGSKRLACV